MTLDELINELIGTENKKSFVQQYNDKENKFNYQTIKNINDVSSLNSQYDIFSNLLEDFQQSYKKLYAIAVDLNQKQEDRDKAKTYMDISALYINIIQNLYINPINYRLNELKTKESLEKANESICIGKISIAVALIIAIVTFGLEFRNSKNQSQQVDNQNKILQCQIDSLKTINENQSLKILELKQINDSISKSNIDTLKIQNKQQSKSNKNNKNIKHRVKT